MNTFLISLTLALCGITPISCQKLTDDQLRNLYEMTVDLEEFVTNVFTLPVAKQMYVYEYIIDLLSKIPDESPLKKFFNSSLLLMQKKVDDLNAKNNREKVTVHEFLRRRVEFELHLISKNPDGSKKGTSKVPEPEKKPPPTFEELANLAKIPLPKRTPSDSNPKSEPTFKKTPYTSVPKPSSSDLKPKGEPPSKQISNNSLPKLTFPNSKPKSEPSIKKTHNTSVPKPAPSDLKPKSEPFSKQISNTSASMLTSSNSIPKSEPPSTKISNKKKFIPLETSSLKKSSSTNTKIISNSTPFQVRFSLTKPINSKTPDPKSSSTRPTQKTIKPKEPLIKTLPPKRPPMKSSERKSLATEGKNSSTRGKNSAQSEQKKKKPRSRVVICPPGDEGCKLSYSV